jgi:hypothetical protein
VSSSSTARRVNTYRTQRGVGVYTVLLTEDSLESLCTYSSTGEIRMRQEDKKTRHETYNSIGVLLLRRFQNSKRRPNQASFSFKSSKKKQFYSRFYMTMIPQSTTIHNIITAKNLFAPLFFRRGKKSFWDVVEVSFPCNKHHCRTVTSLSPSDSSPSSHPSVAPPVTVRSEEERSVQMAAREWARKRLKPLVREMDNNSTISPSILDDLFTHGFMGLEVPEDYGGMNCNFTATCLVVEEIARVDPSVAILVDIHNTLTINALRFWGSSDLQEMWLPRLCQNTVSSFALSEAESGSDAFAMKTTATLSEDGDHYIINGTKLWISNAKEAGVFLLFANADPSKGYKGITAFLVDAANTTADGGTIHVGTPEKKLGLRASSTCPVTFENVRVPYTSVLGTVGMGYKVHHPR